MIPKNMGCTRIKYELDFSWELDLDYKQFTYTLIHSKNFDLRLRNYFIFNFIGLQLNYDQNL